MISSARSRYLPAAGRPAPTTRRRGTGGNASGAASHSAAGAPYTASKLAVVGLTKNSAVMR